MLYNSFLSSIYLFPKFRYYPKLGKYLLPTKSALLCISANYNVWKTNCLIATVTKNHKLWMRVISN